LLLGPDAPMPERSRDMPNPSVCPSYASVIPRLVEAYGQEKAEWMMHRLRNLNV
jgi:anthranilate 1,2-dioxygenase (deaminating, decarboxylating) large subunit